MSRKRRVFDIDLPDDAVEETFPAGKVEDAKPAAVRRGPMATAISENAESLAERHELEAKIRAKMTRWPMNMCGSRSSA